MARYIGSCIQPVPRLLKVSIQRQFFVQSHLLSICILRLRTREFPIEAGRDGISLGAYQPHATCLSALMCVLGHPVVGNQVDSPAPGARGWQRVAQLSRQMDAA
jgi:hypothetical protein